MKAITQPRPGTAAAFKQRREAYAIASSIREQINDARYDLNLRGAASEAATQLEGILHRVERNPEAQRVLAVRAPAALDIAKGLHEQAKAEIPSEVRTTSRTDWRSDGYKETRLEFGQSQKGHHYRMDVATPGYEVERSWSIPFRTEAAARAVGRALEGREHGDYMRHQQPAPTQRSDHAAAMKQAALYRLGARSAGEHSARAGTDRPEMAARWRQAKAGNIIEAGATLAQAKQIRQDQERIQTRAGGHER